MCKLLIILEHINGQVPQEDILNFVRVTFRTIVEAFEGKDLIRLRHIVEFFLEVRGQKNRLDAVALYEQYHGDVLRILDSVENCSATDDKVEQVDLECLALLFEFLHSLVELRVAQLSVLHARMVRLALGWVQTEMVGARALALLRSVAVQPSEAQQQVLEPLASGLSVLLHIIDSSVESGSLAHTETCHKLIALLQLLRVLVCNDALQNHVFATLKQTSILRIFEALLGEDESQSSSISVRLGGTNGAAGESYTMFGQQSSAHHLKEAFCSELNELYVHAVALVCALATYCEQWEPLMSRVFSHRQVHAVLAQAFYADTQPDTKLLLFEMARVRCFPLQQVAYVMCEVQPPSSASHPLAVSPQKPTTAPPPSLLEGMYGCGPPLMSGAQIEQLDRVLERLTEALAGGQVHSVATSEVMELYEYKMAAIGHAERHAQASLEAANQHATHLQHRLAQMSTEVSRLHQLLFHAQQCHEEARRQLRVCEDNAAALSARLSKEQVRAKELAHQLVERERCVDDHQATIQVLEAKLNETVQNHNYLSKKYEDQVNKNIALVKASAAIESNVHTLKATLDDKNSTLARSTLQIETLTTVSNNNTHTLTRNLINTGGFFCFVQQVRELEELRKQHEQTIATRDRELTETNKELEERKRILDTITKLTRT